MTKASQRLCWLRPRFLAGAATALAQGRGPSRSAAARAAGAAEGGITGWLLAEQSRLTHLMAAKVHALHGDPAPPGGSSRLGLAYGVFHAAGPGHGKALIASYMLANERSLRRGAVMALLAALLQALVAVALVGAAGLVLNATASEMNRAADWLQVGERAGVAAIGLWLSWRKGGALIAALEAAFRPRAGRSPRLPLTPASSGARRRGAYRRRRSAPRRPAVARTGGRTAAFCPTPRRSRARFPGAAPPER